MPGWVAGKAILWVTGLAWTVLVWKFIMGTAHWSPLVRQPGKYLFYKQIVQRSVMKSSRLF